MRRAWLWILLCFIAPAVLAQTVGFSSRSTASIGEGAGPANVVLARSGDTSGTTTVTLRFEPDAARLGEDYQAAQTTVTFAPTAVRVVFPPGVTFVAVPVAILQNDRLEGEQRYGAGVAPVSNVLSGDGVTITIRDDEPASWFALAAPSYDVIESAGSVTITVRRTGDRSRPASVGYATGYVDRNPAFTGLDYTPVSGTLAFAPGEEWKSFSIPILDDARRDGPRLFGVGLSSPQGAFLPNGTAGALRAGSRSLRARRRRCSPYRFSMTPGRRRTSGSTSTSIPISKPSCRTAGRR